MSSLQEAITFLLEHVQNRMKGQGVILPRICRWNLAVHVIGDEMIISVTVPGVMEVLPSGQHDTPPPTR